MARRVFYSFHYKPDAWRASKIRNIGAIEGNKPCTDNDWESVTRGGDTAIERWIDEQMKGRTCAIVLVGTNTARRKWIDYEITKAWNAGMGIFGIYIHRITNKDGETCAQGSNPFATFTIGGKPMSSIVPVYAPTGVLSSQVYANISENLEDWIDEAIAIRKRLAAA